MKFVVDDCMDAVLEDTLLIGNVILCYSSVCHDNVMNLGNDILYGDGDAFSDGVVIQTIPAKFEFSILLLHHAVWRGYLP